MLGMQEIVMLIVIGLALFGGNKAPELAKKLGETIKETKNAFKIEE